MPYDPTGAGAIVPVGRIKPIVGSDIGDATAGGSANLQTFVDQRRRFRTVVADLTALAALTGNTTGDTVVVIDTGSGVPGVYVWNGTAYVTATPAAPTVGVIDMQSGLTSTTGSSRTITFPRAFSVTPHAIHIVTSGTPGGRAYQITAKSSTAFTFQDSNNDTHSVYWDAQVQGT